MILWQGIDARFGALNRFTQFIDRLLKLTKMLVGQGAPIKAEAVRLVWRSFEDLLKVGIRFFRFARSQSHFPKFEVKDSQLRRRYWTALPKELAHVVDSFLITSGAGVNDAAVTIIGAFLRLCLDWLG